MRADTDRRAPAGLLGWTMVVLIALTAMACGADEADDEGPQTIRLMTHDSFAVSDDVLASFEGRTGHTVEVILGGDAGTMVNQAVLTKDNPVADVIYGVDTTFLGRALDAGVFTPYETPLLDSVDPALAVDERVTPIDFGDVCLNYDVAGLAERGLTPPSTLADLADPAYAGLLVVEDPGTSSPGLSFLLATIAEFGEPGWQQYWEDLVDNDVLISPDWEAAYYGEFSGGSGAGDRPLVVSYASSPPAEVIFADPRPSDAPTGVVEAGCFRQVEYAGVVAGTPVPNAARELIDFMLGLEFQEDIPLNMFVFPANTEAMLPPEFVEFTTIPAAPASIDPAEIDANRDEWIETWTEVVSP